MNSECFIFNSSHIVSIFKMCVCWKPFYKFVKAQNVCIYHNSKALCGAECWLGFKTKLSPDLDKQTAIFIVLIFCSFLFAVWHGIENIET